MALFIFKTPKVKCVIGPLDLTGWDQEHFNWCVPVQVILKCAGASEPITVLLWDFNNKRILYS